MGFLRKVAENAGFKNVPIISLNTANSSLNKALGISFSVIKDALLALIYGDLLMKLSDRMRPYEAYARQTDNLVEMDVAYASCRQDRKNNIL
ncbi:MAG: hypothetical protein LE178_04215 [Endomicrobium sp.]|nr:hypothetical protein [Endomicrobium sp.]